MSQPNFRDRLILVLGVAGIFALLIAAMIYAVYSSGTHFDIEQINRLVQQP